MTSIPPRAQHAYNADNIASFPKVSEQVPEASDRAAAENVPKGKTYGQAIDSHVASISQKVQPDNIGNSSTGYNGELVSQVQASLDIARSAAKNHNMDSRHDPNFGQDADDSAIKAQLEQAMMQSLPNGGAAYESAIHDLLNGYANPRDAKVDRDVVVSPVPTSI